MAPQAIAHVDGPHLFHSFWIAGFGSNDNRWADRGAPVPQFGPDPGRADRYYRWLRDLRIGTACEQVIWPLVDLGGEIDCEVLRPVLDAADRYGIQVIWDLSLASVPEGLDVMSPDFPPRFAGFCHTLASFIFASTSGAHFFRLSTTPFPRDTEKTDSENTRRMSVRGRPREVRKQIARAAIAGCDAIWSTDSSARIIHVAPTVSTTVHRAAAVAAARGQVDLWDMLTGSVLPELGGSPRYLDIMALSFFPSREPRKRRQVPADDAAPVALPANFHEIARELYRRYERPMIVGEPQNLRGAMLGDMLNELCRAIALGVFFEGVCVDPLMEQRKTAGGTRSTDAGIDPSIVRQFRRCQTVLAQIGWGDRQYVAEGVA